MGKREEGDPKNISGSEHVKAYPDEQLTVSNRELFCHACQEELATKKSSIESHIKSQKHIKAKLELKNKEEYNIVQTHDTQINPAGGSLPDSTRVYRVKVVTAMLKAGIPLSKIDLLCDLLEEHACALTSSTHLRQLIPFILQEELSKEISNQSLSIIFDGTTHVCKAFVVLRYIIDDWKVKHWGD